MGGITISFLQDFFVKMYLQLDTIRISFVSLNDFTSLVTIASLVSLASFISLVSLLRIACLVIARGLVVWYVQL